MTPAPLELPMRGISLLPDETHAQPSPRQHHARKAESKAAHAKPHNQARPQPRVRRQRREVERVQRPKQTCVGSEGEWPSIVHREKVGEYPAQDEWRDDQSECMMPALQTPVGRAGAQSNDSDDRANARANRRDQPRSP
jgi:hypothetical protein